MANIHDCLNWKTAGLERKGKGRPQHRHRRIEGLVELDASAEAGQSLAAEADAA